MKNKEISHAHNLKELRQKAKKIYDQSDLPRKTHNENSVELTHEIHIHKIELEIQNEELCNLDLALEDSREMYSNLFDFGSNGYFILDQNNFILNVNLTATEMLMAERSTLINKPFSKFIFKDDQNIFYSFSNKLIKSGAVQKCELRMVKQDLSAFYVSMDGIIEKNTTYSDCLFISVSNIDERKQTEHKLEEREIHYKALFENLGVPIFEMDYSQRKNFFRKLSGMGVKNFRKYFVSHPDEVLQCGLLGKITDMNPAAEKLFGTEKDSIIPMLIKSCNNEGSLSYITNETIALAENNEIFSEIWPVKLSKRETKYFRVRLNVFPGYQDTLQKVLVMMLDISTRIRYLKKLNKSHEDLKELSRQIENIRERERAAISLNLHDDLGQKLSALKMDLSWIKSRMGILPKDVNRNLKKMDKLIDDSVVTIQKISADLRPAVLYEFGLIEAIKWHICEFSKTSGIL